jgi:DNA-binding NtrC family response regulator
MERPVRARWSETQPLDLPDPRDDVTTASGKHRIAGRLSLPPSLAGRFGVLVVDDDPAMLRSIEAILSFDFSVVSCSNPMEALRIFDPAQFHVVCSDYVMPTMDGRKFLAEIMRRSETVCCVLMTARVELEAMDRDFPVVFKPFDPERFLHTVGHLGRIAEMKRSTRALTEATGTSGAPPRSKKP